MVQTRGSTSTCRNSRTAVTDCAELACCVRHPPRVVIRGRLAPCAELARCVRRRPRVTIDGSNPASGTLLASPSLAQTGGKLSVATRWMCQYPYGKDYGCRPWFKPGGKVTCRNPSSCRYRWLKQGWKLSVATPWCNDSVVTRGRRRTRTRCSCGVCCGVQPRGVTTRVVIRGRRRTVRVVLAQS